MIGTEWLGKKNNTRRIDDPTDFVRLEIQHALKRNILIIPLLIRNASMPNKSELPEEIWELSLRNGIPIRYDPDFNNDISKLINNLNSIKNNIENK